MTETQIAIEKAARDSWGRLLAYLSARIHDLGAAEDALADAFHSALQTWPHSGVPDRPEAWLLVAARRKLTDAARHAQVHADAVPALIALADHAREFAESTEIFPDERLELLFLCAHPAIEVAARTPLMLHVVLGLDAARIASAFLVKPSAMGQRLSRAKAKIRDAGIRFALPGPDALPERLEAVIEAIYAAYGSGWDDVAGADPRRRGLAAEAIDLGRMLVQFMPTEPEAQGLLALMLYCESRRETRRTRSGKYVPLTNQDTSLWSTAMIQEAEQLLSLASRAGRAGRFQLEAAIQAVHAHRLRTGRTDWDAIAVLYEGLIQVAPTIGAIVGCAAAVAEASDPLKGWLILSSIPPDLARSYQPYWALAAHLLKRMGRLEEAADALERAVGLCEDPAMRQFLLEK